MFNLLIILISITWPMYSTKTLAQPFADDTDEYVDYAKVISAEPIYETVQVVHPVKKCWNEEVEYQRGGSAAGAIAGGVVGGVLGHQFGRGSGNAAMTMAGTILGATVGRDLGEESTHTVIADERHCETVDRYTEEERKVGYRVTYRYKGKTLVTRTETDPGDTIPIRVAIEPLP